VTLVERNNGEDGNNFMNIWYVGLNLNRKHFDKKATAISILPFDLYLACD
jgi:hypothetical protein